MKFLYSVALSFISLNAFGYGECTAVKVTEVLAGPQYNSLIRVGDLSCGANGWICTATYSGITEEMSDKIFSIALAAKATGADVNVRWDENSSNYGCNGNFPMLYDIRVK